MSTLTSEAARVRAAAAADGVAAAELVSTYAESEPPSSAHVEALRLAVEVGLLDALVDHAREMALHHAHPWHESGAETADQDPHTQSRFGQAYAVRSAAEALLAEALQALADADPDADRTVALARGYVGRRGGETANDLIGVLGASSASSRYGLDRHWRMLRGFAIEHPPRQIDVAGDIRHDRGKRP